jgi:hypothetical protein
VGILKWLLFALIAIMALGILASFFPDNSPKPEGTTSAIDKEPLPEGVDGEALVVYCTSLSMVMTSNRTIRRTADDAMIGAIQFLAQKEGISLGRARSHLRYLAKEFGSWQDVANECVDRGLMVDFGH